MLTVDAPFGHATLLETLVLSILNHDAAVGTSSHAFTLAHADGREAFDWLVAVQGADTTLLVDTDDIEQGVRNAVAAAGTDLAEVRIDSGDLASEAHRARALLDELGATGTRVMVTGDLDEHALAGLADAPIDAYGFGTRLVTGLPAPGFVYKPVALDGRPVAKTSSGKATGPGRKHVHREYAADGTIVADHVLAAGRRPADDWEPLQHPLVEARDPAARVQDARRSHRDVRARLADSDDPILTVPDSVHLQQTGIAVRP